MRLKQHLSIPIVATEITSGGVYALPRWIAARATDALRGDVVIKGGITGMMKIAALAEANHLPCEVHDAYNAIGNLATVHVVMAVPHCSMYEVLVPHAPGSYDLDHLSYGLGRADHDRRRRQRARSRATGARHRTRLAPLAPVMIRRIVHMEA